MAFYNYIGPRSSPTHSIDRIDNNKGYEPGNVRWATKLEQQRNCRSNIIFEIDGQRMTATQAAEHAGVKPSLVYNRLYRGVPMDQVLLPPVSKFDNRK
jgi:hypothetical protein